ncbi:hypothetical protein ILUMI_24837 [Ignelater luminosus]|uniref:Uncharacterized protein n=1 Tax=Ignelater luminosus TaxID=2038154 RepID=A0A8K0G0I3_IGNLU|nr:hypothetical protein ILUMI_24837 [Ignelater luminosus]
MDDDAERKKVDFSHRDGCHKKIGWDFKTRAQDHKLYQTTNGNFLKGTTEEETVVNPRKKKINVTSEKKVAEEAFIENLKQAQSESTKKKVEKSNHKKKNLYKTSDVDESDDKSEEISLHDSYEELSLLLEADIKEKLEDIHLPSASDGQNAIYKETINEFGASTSAPKQQINDFVIIKFFYDEGKKMNQLSTSVKKATWEWEKVVPSPP